ncbi:MAG TPA: (d)CMP kinase [Candidatus Binataceae bacterium]|nr:(d)CMP kinase [Candidatus Binataceae bacterium]
MSLRARPVVAIDGPVGAGKSTIARALARVLGFSHLNTGAMYRAVALAASLRYSTQELNDPAIERRLGELLNSISITFDGERVLLDGREISHAIATPAISDLASRLSGFAAVRTRMRELQQVAGRGGGIVMEGRDIGTVIFPDADCKFYLTASAAVRAERRFAELAAQDATVTRAQVLAQLQERDQRDQERALAPLKPAADAIVVDSSELDVNEVVELMAERVRSRSRT